MCIGLTPFSNLFNVDKLFELVNVFKGNYCVENHDMCDL